MELTDQFFNNCVITNLLQTNGVNGMQIARVLIGNLTSFIAILIYMIILVNEFEK